MIQNDRLSPLSFLLNWLERDLVLEEVKGQLVLGVGFFLSKTVQK